MALLFVLAGEVLYVTVGPNFHPVVRGRCYRCGQPTADEVERVARGLRIRTIINLRGPNEPEDWYRQERDAAHRAGVGLIDIALSAYSPPSADDLRTLVRALDGGAAEPILLHCQSGSDRTGLASALYLLLHTRATPAEAAGQVSLRFGHNPWGRAMTARHILDGYTTWLATQDRPHAPALLRRWACEVYQ